MPRDQKEMPHLLVDGYNLAHSWSHIAPLFEIGLDQVVEALVRDLRELHDARDLRVSIVLDGQGSDVEVVRPFRDTTFSLVYSPRSLNADAIIEQMVGASAFPEKISVVSRDTALLGSIEAGGATAVSPDLLLEWIDAARRRAADSAKKRSSSTKKLGVTL